MGEEIRANSVLPARREDVEFGTSDGLRLVGELAAPENEPPYASLLTLHPLPTAGGFMDSHIYRKAAWRLPSLADFAVLRFNTRGTQSPRGRSEGEFDEARSERYDVEAMLTFAAERDLPRRWVLGWSFGTDLALKYALSDTIEGVILLSPALRFATDADLDRWAASGLPMTVLVPEFDDYLRPEEAPARFARVPQARVIGVDGAKHLWVGEKYVRRVLDEIVETIRPGAAPLPTTWDGPMDVATIG
jgi:uncharacterized protein